MTQAFWIGLSWLQAETLPFSSFLPVNGGGTGLGGKFSGRGGCQK